jgi:hypothetical protein
LQHLSYILSEHKPLMTAKFQLRNDMVILTDSEEGSDEGMIYIHKSHDNVLISEGVHHDLPCRSPLDIRFLAPHNNTLILRLLAWDVGMLNGGFCCTSFHSCLTCKSLLLPPSGCNFDYAEGACPRFLENFATHLTDTQWHTIHHLNLQVLYHL